MRDVLVLVLDLSRKQTVVAAELAFLLVEYLPKVLENLGAATVELVHAELDDAIEVIVLAFFLLPGPFALLDEFTQEARVAEVVV